LVRAESLGLGLGTGGGVMEELGLATRVKALAVAEPVLDLDRRKRALDKDWRGYQMEELALTAIDSVALKMDFEAGARHEDVAADVARVAAAQMPGRGQAEHAEVAWWVLNGLINVGSIDRSFRHRYGMVTGGRYEGREFDFKLLPEVPGPDGEPRLRVSNEAIAVLVGAVEVDIASEQVAAEAKLDALVKRGKLAQAHRAAQAALRRTIQYGESLRRHLETARRDVRALDWVRDIEGMQREALEHIAERLQAENAIRDNLAQIVDNAAEEEQATTLIAILDECVRRHVALQAALLEAGATFRAEQVRQTFVAPPARSLVDLYPQLLAPVLDVAVPAALPALAGFFGGVSGPARPAVAYLPDLVSGLMRWPSDLQADASLVDEPELEPVAPEPRFSGEQYAAAGRLFGEVTAEGTRLSALLLAARRRGTGTGTDLLVALHAMGLFGAPCDLVAVDDGRELADPRFAGTDLLVRRVAS
jgi:hypothetical protein